MSEDSVMKGGEPGRNLVVEAVDPTTRSKGLLILYGCRSEIPIYEESHAKVADLFGC